MSIVLTEQCKKWLGHLVLTSIESVFAKSQIQCPAIPHSFSKEECAILEQNLGSFVTLKKEAMLRGCIGAIVGYEPLYQNVWRMAQQAAFSDPRFPPLQSSEWEICSLEISVLSAATPCTDVNAIEIGKHGLILQFLGRTGVFLPQVPVEQNWNLSQYLDHLCLKAGVAVGSWKNPQARLFWYEATVFPVER